MVQCCAFVCVVQLAAVCCIQLQQVNQCPLFVQLCLFNRLIRAIQYHLRISQNSLQTAGNIVHSPSVVSSVVYLCYFDICRLQSGIQPCKVIRDRCIFRIRKTVFVYVVKVVDFYPAD